MQHKRRTEGDEGFTLVEVVVALGVFAILATAFASTLSASLRSLGLSRQRTTAEQLASSQLEEIRRIAYDDVGTVGGNPPGVVTPTKTVTSGNQSLTVKTAIAYVNDKVAIANETGADYKSVVVTVTSQSSTVLAQQKTFVAPPTQASQTNALMKVTVSDFKTLAALPNATVSLGTGPSAPISDTSDANGKVAFARLQPNPTSGSQSTYQVTAALAGYQTYPDDIPPSPNVTFSLSGGAVVTPVIRMYKAVTLNITLVDETGAPFTAATTVTGTSTRGTDSMTVTGGSASVTTINALPLLPGDTYTIGAQATGYTASSTQVTMATGYPSVLTSNVTLVMRRVYGQMQVTVKYGTTTLGNMTVNITAGPDNVNLTGTTNSSGVAIIAVPSGTSPVYTITVPAQATYRVATATKAGPVSTETVSLTILVTK